MTREQFSQLLDAALSTRQADNLPADLTANVSIADVLRQSLEGTRITGRAREVHEELCKRDNVHPDSISGTRIAFSSLVTRRMQRDLSAGVFSQGGATIQTDVPNDPIELLLNKATAARAGATTISGLKGNVGIPRVTSAPTAQSLSESATATKSNSTFDQVLMAPHRITVTVDVTRQLVIQSSIGVENFLRDLMAQMIALKLDSLFYYGQGDAGEPQGVVNTPGVGAVLFGGAATYSKLVDFEGNLAASNADVVGAKLAYVTTPTVRSTLKKAAKLLTGATTVAAQPLWESGNGEDGIVNGTRAMASNQIQNNQVIYGNFADTIIGIFGNGVDLIANPYSRDTDAVVRLTMHLFADIAMRHPVSFCVSSDAGNQ